MTISISPHRTYYSLPIETDRMSLMTKGSVTVMLAFNDVAGICFALKGGSYLLYSFKFFEREDRTEILKNFLSSFTGDRMDQLNGYLSVIEDKFIFEGNKDKLLILIEDALDSTLIDRSERNIELLDALDPKIFSISEDFRGRLTTRWYR